MTVARFIAALLLVGTGQAQQMQEYELKAGFLFNFVRFVEWPVDAFVSHNDPLAICLYAEDPFQGAMERAVAGKTVGERAVVVRHVPDAGTAGGCHLLFVPASQDRHTRQISTEAAKQPVLLVGEASGFAERGGSVNFVLEGSRLRFQINPAAASDRGLKVSSKLLQLAIIVNGRGSR
jgi:hypothetical protein